MPTKAQGDVTRWSDLPIEDILNAWEISQFLNVGSQFGRFTVIAQAKENTSVGRIGPACHPKQVGQTYSSRAQKGEFPGASRGRLSLETKGQGREYSW